MNRVRSRDDTDNDTEGRQCPKCFRSLSYDPNNPELGARFCEYCQVYCSSEPTCPVANALRREDAVEVTQLSKMDALLHAPAPEEKETFVTPTTIPEYVRCIQFHQHHHHHDSLDDSFEATTTTTTTTTTTRGAVGKHRCQLICQMYLHQYRDAKLHDHDHDNDGDDNEDVGPAVANSDTVATDDIDNDDDDDDDPARVSIRPSETASTLDTTTNTSNEKDSSTNIPNTNTQAKNLKVPPLLEQVYQIIFHQHCVDEKGQRSGAFVMIVPQFPPKSCTTENNDDDDDDDDDNQTRMVELPKPWALEFIRQQFDQMLPIRRSNGPPDSTSPVTISTTTTHTTTTTTTTTDPSVKVTATTTTTKGPPVAMATETKDATTVTTKSVGITKEPVHHHHNNPPLDDETIKRRRRSSLLRRSVSSGDVFADHKKRMAIYRGSIVQHALDDVNDNDDDDDDQNTDVNDSDSDDEGNIGNRDLHLSYDSLKSATSEVKQNHDRKHGSAADGSSSSRLDEGADWAEPPSFSRYTSTQSILSQSSLLSWNRALKKAANRQRPVLERTPSWSEGITDIQTNHDGNVIVHTANALDVIFMKKANIAHRKSDVSGDERYQLIPTQHTGNSRILVMVQLDLPKYLEYLQLNVKGVPNSDSAVVSSSISTTTADSPIRQMLRDIVNVVHTNYNGRFLMEQSDTADDDIFGVNHDDDYYVLLTDEQAISAVECIFRDEQQATEQPDSEIVDGRVETTAVPLPGTGGDHNDGQTASTVNSTKNRTPSMIKRETMEQLLRLSTTVSDALTSNGDESVDGTTSTTTANTRKSTATMATTSSGTTIQNEDINIHKSAISSLQQRAVRKGLSKKIGQLGVRNNPSATAILESQLDGAIQSVDTFIPAKPRSASLLFPNPIEYMHRNHTTGHSDNFYSSVPAGLNFDYLNDNDTNRFEEYSQGAMRPPTKIGLMNDLPTDYYDMNPMTKGDPLPMATNGKYDVQRRNAAIYPPHFQLDKIEDNQYYQVQCEQQMYLMQQQQQQQLQQQQQQWYNAPNQLQQHQHPHQSRRRPTLSKFSQDMMQEMLMRAHCTAPSAGISSNNYNQQLLNSNFDSSSNMSFSGHSQQQHYQNDQRQQHQGHPNPQQHLGNMNGSLPAAPIMPVTTDAAATAYQLGLGGYEV